MAWYAYNSVGGSISSLLLQVSTTVTVVEQSTDSSGPTTEEVDDDEGGLPGFGFLPAIAAIGAVLLLRRRL